MKKILALALTGMLVMGGSVAAGVATAETEVLSSVQTQTSATQATQKSLYLVPGTYTSAGAKVENTVGAGAEKLNGEQCDAIYTENAYLCNLSAGDALPVPQSEREGYAFNGWWTIVDATVTYFDKVPEISETTFLYADWRADLSQRKDPIEPDESTIVKPLHYMSIKRAKTGEEETVTLRVSGSDMPSAMDLGYGRPVQLYNGWFELNPGDVITVYTAGLGDYSEAQIAPIGETRKITLENSSTNGNSTGSFLTASSSTAEMTYRKVLKTRHFRIYVKFYSKGSDMAVYLEPMD